MTQSQKKRFSNRVIVPYGNPGKVDMMIDMVQRPVNHMLYLIPTLFSQCSRMFVELQCKTPVQYPQRNLLTAPPIGTTVHRVGIDPMLNLIKYKSGMILIVMIIVPNDSQQQCEARFLPSIFNITGR